MKMNNIKYSFIYRSYAIHSAITRLDGRVVMQRPAKPFTPVRFRLQPPYINMKVGIIGFGFVGKAYEMVLKMILNILP